MSDIFISYASEDRPQAKTLAESLEAQGWSVWWDRIIPAGRTFDDVIEEALDQAKCVIVMWSGQSVASRWVRTEAAEGAEREILVPVLIEDVRIPLAFRRIHAENLSDWDGSDSSPEFQKLVEDIAGITGPPRPQTQHQAQTRAEPIEKKAKPQGATPREPRRKPALRKPGTVFRDTLKDGSKGPEMVVIPAGEFQMGDSQGSGLDWEKPVHKVHIAKPFAMGKYPVTFEDYDRFAEATGGDLPSDQEWGRENRPVINVSWKGAMAYTKWLSEQTGKRYRLPTEAEWEYAARAGTKTDYWWGNEMKSNMADCKKSFIGTLNVWSGTTPVGSFPANPFGLHDAAGNVEEWVQDCWHENYESAPTDGSAWLEEGGGDCTGRVFRGGCWVSEPRHVRSAARTGFDPDTRDDYIGFRLARDL
ncbi:MAG: SUMF1/EgtB/PvdO family nonheme iron enzyme [Gammaproteobacteria bacterium]|nr:SUMF1/EgtB/PvdO family nonheme iron enzyme [Gammaproteobacteria bacterium]